MLILYNKKIFFSSLTITRALDNISKLNFSSRAFYFIKTYYVILNDLFLGYYCKECDYSFVW